MEADWEFEIGTDAPVIDAHWEGYVDLRAHPERAAELSEAIQFSALANALVRLNASASPVWTSKCDVWQVDLDENPVDAFEIDAAGDALSAAYACYIDILSSPQLPWSQPKDAEAFCRALCVRLGAIPLRSTRADLVIRRAVLAGGEESVGVTTYLVAAGGSHEAALQVLAHGLSVFADSILAT